MNLRSRRWLKVVLLGCVLGLALVLVDVALWMWLPAALLPARFRQPPPFRLSVDPEKHELLKVVNTQLLAFRQNDYATAYACADSAIQKKLSVAGFEEMVKKGYPGIAHSRSASFGIIVDNGEQAYVKVGITGISGHTLQYCYLLVREPGGWRISGVIQIPREGITV
jgi:Domain of unknown function (DUF4864)